MIRFVDLQNQIYCDADIFPENKPRECFAFFDTVTDKFLEINTSQTWDNITELLQDLTVIGATYQLVERLYNLTPDKYKT